jgi:hypothetical protein
MSRALAVSLTGLALGHVCVWSRFKCHEVLVGGRRFAFEPGVL